MAVAQGESFGKYRIERALAVGGMAELFLARQSGPGGFEKRVVIKRTLPHLATNPEFVRMFLDEARIAARLSHPNIVQVFDFGEAGGSYFLVMEYLAGEDLDTILAALRVKGRTMPPGIAALITSAACEALQYAHSFVDENGTPLKIVHRDVSPSNIFLTHQGIVKLLDFGIAKAEGKLVHTEGGMLKGKFFYMSPEQVRGQALDGRSDVFALGAVLHELLTGHPTFERASALDAMKAIADEPIPRPSDLVGGVPMDLEAVVSRALEREPRLRWQSASDMRLALDRFIAKSSSAPSSSRLQDFLGELVDDGGALERASPGPAGAVHSESPGGTLLHQSSHSQAPPQNALADESMADLAADRSHLKPVSEAPTSVGAVAADSPSTRVLARVAPSSARKPISVDDLVVGAELRGRTWKLGAGSAALAGIILLGWSVSRATELELGSLDVRTAPTVTRVPEASPSVEAAQPSLPTPVRARPPTSGGPTAARPLKRATVSKPTADTGTLDINCIPWCRVYIDGRDTKLYSPAKGIVLSIGHHEVRLVNPPSRATRELRVQVDAGAAVRRVIRF
jgi:serine/threonine protein kinase